jgi:hypothetical protein
MIPPAVRGGFFLDQGKAGKLMSFYGREPILARVSEMIVVNDNNRVPANSTKSILIVEGCGGSGRSELIAEIARRWAAKAPTAKLDALAFKRPPDQESGPTAVTVLLGSMMRQFTNSVPGYKVSWGRMSLMLIAMVKPVSVAAPDDGEQEMLSRMADASRDRRVLENLLGWLMSLPLSIPVTAGAVTVDVGPLAKPVAEQVVKRLSRSARHPEQRWQPALSWFAPPGEDGNLRAAVRELIRFSRIAGEVAGGQDSAQRLQADSLLMNAFLSDLAESAAHLHGRPNNFVLLLDNADCPAGEELLAAVARARREMFRWPAGLDPLAVAAAGGKPRVLDQVSLAAADSEPGVEDRPDVVRLRLGDLSGPEVAQLVGEYPWGAADIDPPAHVVAHLVYLLTDGHCLAARLVLRELQLDPSLAADLNRLLGTPEAGRVAPAGEADAAKSAPSGVAQRVLHVIAAGLAPHGAALPYFLQDMVTLCAARHRDEARRLRGQLLTAKVNREQLFSDVLWSHPTPDGHRAMVPIARHLLLRELAARPQSSLVSWESLFQDLGEKQAKPHEGERARSAIPSSAPAPASDQTPAPAPASESDVQRADRLHHLLALGKAATVADEMAALVPRCPEATWLTWLDAITITPVPQRLTPADLPENVEGLRRNVFQLITALQQVADPCGHTRDRLHELYSKISSAYTNMTEHAPAHWQIIANRAESFRVRANQIA